MTYFLLVRKRLQRESRVSKGASMDGAMIYDDLTTTQSGPSGPMTTIDPNGRTQQIIWTPVGPRSHPRYVQAQSIGRPHLRYKIPRGEDHSHAIGSAFAEPVYQTISSGSGMSEWFCFPT